MSTTEMLTVFTYDIESNQVRRRVAGILEDIAVRVQKSVFETRLTESQALKIGNAIALELHDGDSLRIYAISADTLPRTMTFGSTSFPQQGDFYLV